MREIKIFKQRRIPSNSREVLKKYILFFEGHKSEPKYFKSLNFYREKIEISAKIDIKIKKRNKSKIGNSNPSQIIQDILKTIDENEQGCMTYKSLFEKIERYFEDNNLYQSNQIKIKDLNRIIIEIFKNKDKEFNENNKVEDLYKECKYVSQKLKINDFEHFFNDMESEDLIYDKEIDEICIIVDRDKHSFTSSQYKNSLDKCKQNKFNFCVSNPCFEFWLLLHFDKIHSLDRQKLLNNQKVNKTKKYIEKELSNIFKYNKASYDTEKLIENIDKAIENEKLFCENIKDLENQLGSSIGKLISKMRDKNQ